MELIVDGYNLIGADQGLGGNLELKRNDLLQRLVAYQKNKQIPITVVFDGWRFGSRQETLQKRDGISVVYSRLDEKADSVIIRLARPRASGTVVISSDREIRSAVERFGAVALSSDSFNAILRSAAASRGDEGDEDEEDELDWGGEGRTRRASKTERRRREALRKLRA